MNSLTDQQLLREYTGSRSEPAFAELLRRHVDLVYSAALRMVCNPHLAEDVTQGVFVALAQNAGQLTDRPVLSGWLHRTARNLAANAVRSDVRRRAREQEAAAMNELLTAESDPVWEQIAPHLDAALSELSEVDRDALLLRYFERKSAREMAQTLGTSEEAAQKRVGRAVERLRECFAQRGVTVGASGLVLVVSANAVQSAPVGLVVTISAAAAALAGPALATTATATATKFIAMTALQKTLITATILVAFGTGIYEARQASTLRSQVQTLEQRQAPLAEQLAELKSENERLSKLVAQPKDSPVLAKDQFHELLKLRSQAALAGTDSRELAKLKSALAEQNGKVPDYLTNAMAAGMATADMWKKKEALAKLARMKRMLNLTDDQQQAISDIMMKHIQHRSEMTLDLMTGKSTAEQRAQAVDGDQDAEIKALLTPEQLATFPEYEQAEIRTAADNSARSDASRLAEDFSLSKEQQEKVRLSFYEMNLKDRTGALSRQGITEALKSGNVADAANMGVELQKFQLEEKLKVLDRFLSPEQLTTYRQEQMDQINRQIAAMKLLHPEKSVSATN